MFDSFKITCAHLKVLVFLACLSLVHCCAKQPPPNFGVPVYKPSGQTMEEDNRTKGKEVLSRQERSVQGRPEGSLQGGANEQLQAQGEPEVVQVEMLKMLQKMNNRNLGEKTWLADTNLLRVWNLFVSGIHGAAETKPSSKDSQTQTRGFPSQNLRDRLKRSASSGRASLPAGGGPGTPLGEEAPQAAGTSGWNTAAAVTGFVLTAVMLLGVTCFVRNSCRSQRNKKELNSISLMTDKNYSIYESL